ncbi:hypothetical protein ASPZODRAFT_59440 [Penicilliopsis zonata CBS 506.65]|uniref:AAA+ ATPase domain-containing protein n=1 Tax=Penicilliopsis zonata CBS 506.65 TaxID=1073090 RepID=A0A1L9STG9_9EURO|nr:hypothetical protein ASPZODRAFT_59440 [Penicilliopsis zonata CBS 506.65]OJJ50411.1 hypothetical protein ASPZODRAFT_59440 [Penicilliopsis zonata CBS 506.65]
MIKDWDDDWEAPEPEEVRKKRMKEWEESRHSLPWKAVVDFLDYNHFKNRYSPEEGLAIIEVLLGAPGLAQDIWRESSQRRMQSMGMRMMMMMPPGASRSREEEDSWVQRVRIQSPQLLLILSRLTGHGDKWSNSGPRLFYRPFVALHYYLPQMKECLTILEAHWSKASQTGDSDAGIAGSPAVSKRKKRTEGDDSDPERGSFRPQSPAESVLGPIADSVTALHHVRKYVEFMEKEIEPLWKRAAGNTHRRVSFVDLWMSFQPGELIYLPSASEVSAGQIWPEPANMSQKLWRLHTICRDPYSTSPHCDIPMNSGQELDLWCYFIDYNGVSYEPYPKRFSIKAYEGQRDITTLQAYPLRFYKEKDDLLESQRQLGESFQWVLKERYLYYEGWTLAHEPTTSSTDRGTSEHVDGPVMIDFVEAHKFDDGLATKSGNTLTGWAESNWDEKEDPSMIQHWDVQQYRVLGEIVETLQVDESFAAVFSQRDFQLNNFLKAVRGGKATQIDAEDLVLLPRRLVGYTFHDRRFVRLDVKGFRLMSKAENVFRDLKIDQDHKRMVRALVKSHFQKQKLNLDLIRGKGSGLVILLHGVPGVGKTATAEAVAQANNKPLFAITCGDLGFQADGVESNLKEIFRLAHLWDCVLLLDEADIFLTRRDLDDLTRNALVSVFLRVLEYYSGVLFLTTNRVGLLDEAFKSRIHLSLHYKYLSEDQTLAIFRNNIGRLRKAEELAQKKHAEDPKQPPRSTLKIDEPSILHYAKWYFNNYPDHRWNGRQIRNAFQIAYSFAHFDMQPGSQDTWDEQAEEDEEVENDEDNDNDNDESSDTPQAKGDASLSQPQEHVLDYHQFELIAKTIRKFDKYLWETTGETEGEQAFHMSIRADDYDPDELENDPVYNPQPPPPRRRQQGLVRGRGGQPRGRGGPARGGTMARPDPRANNQRVPEPYKPLPKNGSSRQGEGRNPPSRTTTPQKARGGLSASARSPADSMYGGRARAPAKRVPQQGGGSAGFSSRQTEYSGDDYLDAGEEETEAYETFDPEEDESYTYEDSYYEE